MWNTLKTRAKGLAAIVLAVALIGELVWIAAGATIALLPFLPPPAHAHFSTQPPQVRDLGDSRVIGYVIGANMNVTTDQAIAIAQPSTRYVIQAIWVTNCSANLTTAAGGVYPTTAKGGTAIVAAGQVYSALTAATILLPLTIAAGNVIYNQAIVYLSLTTPQGSAATCDVYVIGMRVPTT